jgi:6,7-dimethyl-8-ribityllumazine synthase
MSHPMNRPGAQGVTLSAQAGAGLRVAIVVARFNATIGAQLLASAAKTLKAHAVNEADISVVHVPGALELPLALKALAESARFDALIALGCVVRGDTYHFEIVSDQSAAGIMHVQLTTGVPIANGVLTTENDEQALVRTETKGQDCALAALEMALLLRDIRSGGL